MNWTDVHAVLKHLKNVDMPKAEEQFEIAKQNLAEYTKQRGRKPLQMQRAEAIVKLDRIRKACEAISDLQIGDIVDDQEIN